MRQKKRSLQLRECYEILGLPRTAALEDVKHAYRLKAFELHPDLNPDDPDASKKFQFLNEAYVALSGVLKAEEEKEGQKEKEERKDSSSESFEQKKREQADHAYAEQDVLRDLLNDPFARRVFEDIYSELNRKQQDQKKSEPPPRKEADAKPREEVVRKKNERPKEQFVPLSTPPKQESHDSGMGKFVKNWLRRQIDEELTFYFPENFLHPGHKLRLQIRQGLSNEVRNIEVTLPSDFVIGKPFRLRGLGRHVGFAKGDLYITLKSREARAKT